MIGTYVQPVPALELSGLRNSFWRRSTHEKYAAKVEIAQSFAGTLRSFQMTLDSVRGGVRDHQLAGVDLTAAESAVKLFATTMNPVARAIEQARQELIGENPPASVPSPGYSVESWTLAYAVRIADLDRLLPKADEARVAAAYQLDLLARQYGKARTAKAQAAGQPVPAVWKQPATPVRTGQRIDFRFNNPIVLTPFGKKVVNAAGGVVDAIPSVARSLPLIAVAAIGLIVLARGRRA